MPLRSKGAKQSAVIDKYEWLGLVILVAHPRQRGGGTGALVAAMLNMRLKRRRRQFLSA